MMSFEQRINLKFLVGLGKTPIETFKLLQEIYGDAMMSKAWIFEWHKRFKEGREYVKEKVCRDHCFTVRIIADELSMNSESVWRNITEDLCENGTKVAK